MLEAQHTFCDFKGANYGHIFEDFRNINGDTILSKMSTEISANFHQKSLLDTIHLYLFINLHFHHGY